ncbi:MAG: sulfotransferase family protein [Flammeovirgaceae bacterium]
MIINLISTPRNISTALMYSFAQRNDTQVIDEPFYAYYLQKTGTWHPGRAEVIASMSTNFHDILQTIYQQENTIPRLFIKNMAHHLTESDLSFLKQMKNLFFIRNPKQPIASFAQVIKYPTMQDIGVKHQYELYEYLIHAGHQPVVLDSGELLKNPKKVLMALCDSLAIPYDEAMLSWEAGPRPEDGVWGKHWYKNVHQSTGFQKQKSSERLLPKHCEALYLAAKPYYDSLFQHSIKA